MLGLVLVLRLITLFGWLYWLIFYWRGGLRLIEDIRESFRAGQSRWDALLIILIALLSLMIIASSVMITFGWQPVQANIPLTVVGALITLSGMAGTFYCRGYLGRFWSAQAAMLDEHRVVDKGPYGIVRHPIYTSAIILYLGTALTFFTSSNLQAAILISLAYVIKAELEDRFLAERLAAYRLYRKRVPYRLIPLIW